MISAGRLTALTLLAACSLLPVRSTAAQEAPAQQPDVAQLVHPDVAERLSLDDAQRAKIQQLLLERAQGLADELAASPSDDPEAAAAAKEKRKAQMEKSRQEILGVLTPEQLAQWTAHQPEQKLMFQFREMKWQDVLNWFADQQDLTLVMDRVPAGTFTYSDTRSYSPSEGIDLLNSVLMTRGSTLVRRDKMLVVMDLNDSIPLELLPRVPLENLDERGRFELVSVMFPLDGRPVDAVLQEVKPYLSNYGRAIPLARGGQLLVVETAGKMRTINELIASVPLPKQPPKPDKPAEPPKPVFAAYTLGGLDSGAVMETIRKLIPSEQITVDGRTGVLSAFVIPDQQAAIKSAIDQMQASRAALPDAESVAYQFSGMKPEDVQQQIAGLAPRATITVTQNRVLVTADAADQEIIRDALAALQIEPMAAERDLQVFEVSKSSAEQVGTALRTFLPNSFVVSNSQTGSVLVRGSTTDLKLAADIVDIWQQTQESADAQLKSLELDRPATTVWLKTVQDIVPDTKVWLSEQQPGVPQQLMLLGTVQDIARIEDLLPQLLTSLPAADRRQLQIYPLSENQAARQSTLTTLPGELADIRQVVGQSGRELLVWATPAQHAIFAELLEQIDQPVPKTTVVPKSYRLEVQNSATVTQLLTAEFPSARLTVNTKGDELTVLASAEQHVEIAQRVAEFNQELPSKAELTVKPYFVEGMTALALQQSLLPLLATAQTTVDSQSERLLVRADAATHAELQEVADALGAKPDVERQKVVIAYPLTQATATNVKLLLDQIVRDATVLADDKLRQVVVTGSLQTQAQVKAAVDQIDLAGGAPQTMEIRSYDAGQLTASALLVTLQAMWPNMQLSVDATTNQIVASGTQRDQQELEAALLQLTSAPGGESQLAKTYPVPFGEMYSLATVLRQLAPRALISADPVSRTVTVWAVEAQQKKVEQALKALSDTASEAQHPATYMVKPSQVYAAQASLRTLFPTAVSSFDPTTGQMVVVASQQVQERIAGVFEMLAKGAGADEKTTKVFEFDPKQVQLNSILVALQSMIPAQVRLEANLANNTLLAIGSPEDLARVSEQVAQLTEQLPPPDELTSVVYTLKHANPLVAVPVLARLLPTATLVPDVTSKTISATAKEDEHKTIKEFLVGFDQPVASDKTMEIHSYDAGQLTASALLITLQSMWPNMKLTADATTNQIVASGTQQDQQELEAAILQLTSAPGGESQLAKTYPVPFGEMTSLTTVLRQLAPRALISVDPVSRTVTVWAVETQQKKVEQALKALSQAASESQHPATYMVKPSQVYAVQASLRTLFPSAVSSFDPTTGQMVVVASQEVQERIAGAIEMLAKGAGGAEKTTKVFEFDPKQVQLNSILVALQSMIPAQVRLEANPANNTLLAIGSPEDLARVSEQVAQLTEQLPPPDELTSVVYPLKHANPMAAVTVLARLLPTATLAPDIASKTISATAEEDEHKAIKEFLVGFDQPVVSDKETRVYKLQRGSGRGLSYVLTSLMPDATFYGSYDSGGLIATALPEQHERIAAVVKEFDVDRENTQTRVFPVGRGGAYSMQTAIRDIASEASVTADSASNSIIVTATVEDLERISQVIDQVEKGGGDARETRFYPILGSEPVALSRALESSFPKATFSADSASGGLFATATPQEHTELAKVIDELNLQPTRLPTLKAFKLKDASPEIVATAIQDALGRRSLAGVSFNRETRSVFVVGSRDDLQVAETLVEQIDVPSSDDDSRKLRVFSLGGADGRSLTSAIENLFQESSAQVDVRYDSFNEQLFVVGDPAQLKLVEEMLEQLTPPDRQLRIVQLEATDPNSFKLAADALFADEPINSTPSITVDTDQQRVIIRATAPQMAELQELLQQMGEVVGASQPANHARLRFIPIPRNSEKLLDEMRRLWPASGGNPIQIVRPPAPLQSTPNPGTAPNSATQPARPPEPVGASGAVGVGKASRDPQAPVPGSDSGDQESEAGGRTDRAGEKSKLTTTKLTSAPQASPTDTDDNTAGDSVANDQPVETQQTPLDEIPQAHVAVPPAPPAPEPNQGDTQLQAAQMDLSPIVVVVGDDQWTVASSDTQALDRFQRLLDTLLSPRAEPLITTGNYSVYLLRNAGADAMQTLLDDLFRPERGRSRGSSFSDLLQRVKIVADSRINALIVSGNRQDRRTVEELLGVLDSEDLLDSLQQITPTTLALKSATAVSVERILRDVYRSQMSAAAGRRPFAIPEGVSSDVALIMQQINAQAAGPLLTLAVDETSNSIIFRAPIELAAEVRLFVENLDRTSQETPSKRVDVIRLQSTNARSLQQALKILLAK